MAQRRQVIFEGLKIDHYNGTAKAELRFLSPHGIVQGDRLSLRYPLSPELYAKIRFLIEEAIAAQIGADVETASDGTVPPDDEDNIPF